MKRGLSQHDRNVIADMKQQFGDHARFGELRKDGGVYPVRPQPAASTEGIKNLCYPHSRVALVQNADASSMPAFLREARNHPRSLQILRQRKASR